MKQTNNAIKFLMAQYRAIFRNANLKMFLAAATAAAALASTQAQAASAEITDSNFEDITASPDKPEGFDLNGTDSDPYSKIAISANGALSNDEAFSLNLVSGDHSIESAADTDILSVTAGNAGINISGEKAKLTVGGNKSGATVTLGSLKVAEGTLEVGVAAATKNTSVTAKEVSIVATDKKTATVKVEGKGSLVGSKSLSIGKGADVTVGDDALIKGKTVAISDGAITLSGGSDTKFSTIQSETALNITGGTVTLSDNNGQLLGGTIEVDGATTAINNSGKLNIGSESTSSFTLTNGTIENKTDAKHVSIEATNVYLNGGNLVTTGAASSITLKGDITTSGTKITNDGGKLIIIGSANFKDGTIDLGEQTNKSGSTVLSAVPGKTSTLTLSSKELGNVMKGGLIASGDGAGVVEIEGASKINLGTADGAGLLTDNDGKVSKKLQTEGDSTLKVKGGEAEFTKFDTLDGDDKNVVFEFNTLKIGSGDTVVMQSGAGVEVSNLLTVAKGESASTLKVVKGSVTLNGDSGSVAAKAINLEAAAAGTSDDATLLVKKGTWGVKSLTLTKGKAAVDSGATLNVAGDLTVTAGSVDLTNKATLNVTGKLSTAAGTAGKITADNSKINAYKGGDIALSGQGIELSNNASLILDKEDVIKTVDNKQVLNEDKFAAKAVTGSANTTIVIKDADGKGLSMTAEEFKTFQEKTEFAGLFEVELTELTGDAKPVEGMNLDKVVGNASTQAYKDIGVKVTDGSTEVTKNASVGNVQVQNNKDLTLGTGGALTLNKPSAEGFFVSKSGASGPEVANVTFNGTDNSLTLGGTGKIGAVSIGTGTGAKGQLTIGSSAANGTVTVLGDIGATGSNNQISSVIVNGANQLVVSGSVYTNTLDLKKGSSIDAASGAIVVEDLASIMGNVDANELVLSGAAANGVNALHTIAGNADVDVTTLKLAAGNDLTIGQDEIEGKREGSTAAVFVDNLDLAAGSAIFIDPPYGQKATVLAAQNLADKSGADTGVLNGDIFVGQNAAFGYGFDQVEFEGVMANYLDANGSFSAPEKGGLQNALVLGKPLTIKSGAGILVQHDLKDADIQAKKGTIGDSLTLGAGSALILTKDAFAGNANGQAAITFGKDANATYTATVTASEKAKISLVGDFTMKSTDLKIFGTTTPTTTTPGQTPTATLDIKAPITVEAMGGLLSAKLDASSNGTLANLDLAPDAEKLAHAGVARSMGDFYLDLAKGNIEVNDKEVGYNFVVTTVATPGGFQAVDAAAHAATYAGAQQAAVAAVGTMAEAVGGRVGSMGVEAATIAATGSQANGGVWLAPMYKSVDADGFNAEGASYGADVDLAGVAFGADTVNGNMRFGAVFNIGSGDADGKGNGNGLKDEFDYYGFGIYSVMGFGNLALVGDASLNVISHDVEGLGLKGEADTTAVTMGITGQYTIANPMVDVTPHLGARFIRLDTDSYDLTNAKGTVATTDFEVQNVFSVPLGVTLSKAFEMGGWSLAPSADLSVTFNTGDTEVDSTTRFTGINRNIGLNTEVLDEVTYGVAVGLGAQYGAFGTQIGINYTGSENTDAFGVNANARYMF